MNVHHKVSVEHQELGQSAVGTHPLDQIDAHYLCDRLTAFTPSVEQIDLLMERARRELHPVRLASTEVVRRVAIDNPDSFWAVARRTPNGGAEPRGLVMTLMLNTDGVDALLRGTLDRHNPPRELLVGQHQRPAGIYGWLIHLKGRLAPGLTLVMEKLQAPLYRGVDIVCRASTKEGAAFFDALGFTRGVWWDGEFHEDFRHYRRSHAGAGDSLIAARLRPPFDDYLPNAPQTEAPFVTTRVVHTLDEMLKVFAIRSAVYIGEQECPIGEEFDGNDFSGTHLLAMIGDEPAGCLRIRYFADFAKIERVAVLERFRLRGIGKKLVVAATELCRAKGYRRLYAHARRSLMPFWVEQGFREMGAAPFAFSDHEYVEITRDLEPNAHALALAAGPFVLIRPEGQWDRPGVLEQSAVRGVAERRSVA
jgi:predicted GNAT family N-acyltransferase